MSKLAVITGGIRGIGAAISVALRGSKRKPQIFPKIFK